MSKLCFLIPGLKVEFKSSTLYSDWKVAVAGGRLPLAQWLKELAENFPIYCADKGIEAVLAANLIPKALFGDGDSASKESYEQASFLGTEIIMFPKEKDDTDLQLLLKSLKSDNLCISGIWGGRFDHLYSNVFSLLNWSKLTGGKVIMADEKEIMVLLQAGEEIKLTFQDSFKVKALSILNLSSETQVDFKGVHWPLNKAKLEYLHPYAISNEPEAREIYCHCYSGDLGVYICLQE